MATKKDSKKHGKKAAQRPVAAEAQRTIQVGLIYSVKVGGTYLPVRVDVDRGKGRYEGAVLPSGKTVKFGAAAVRGDGQTPSAWEARRTPEPTGTAPTEAQTKVVLASGATRKAKADKPAKERKPSGLDAAATVLAEAGEPLNTKTMVERMLAKGLWTTGGKTPASTIYTVWTMLVNWAA